MSMQESYSSQNNGAGSSNYDTFDQAKQKTGEVIDQVQQKAGDAVSQVRDQLTGQISNQKTQIADGLGSVAHMVRMSSDQLRQGDQSGIAQYTDKLADSMEKFSGYLRDRELGDMLNEAQDFARREPALFLGGAFVAGLLAARFFRSSSPSQNQSSQSQGNYGYSSSSSYGGQQSGSYSSMGNGMSRGTGSTYGSTGSMSGATGSSYSGTGSTYGSTYRDMGSSANQSYSGGASGTNWGSGSPNLSSASSNPLTGEASDARSDLRGVELEGSDIPVRDVEDITRTER